MIRQIRFYIFTLLITIATDFLPADAEQTWEWVTKMPIEK